MSTSTPKHTSAKTSATPRPTSRWSRADPRQFRAAREQRVEPEVAVGDGENSVRRAFARACARGRSVRASGSGARHLLGDGYPSDVRPPKKRALMID